MKEAFLKKLVIVCAIAVSFFLVLGKGIAWYYSDSVSLLSSLIDSLIDSFSSSLNLIAIYHAVKPADDKHRFGYGKAEALAAFVQSLFVLGSASFIFKGAGEKLIHPQPIEHSELVISVTIFSILLTAVLLVVQKWVMKRTRSLAVHADHVHYQTDFLINGGVLLTTVGQQYFEINFLDPFFGLIVGIYIVRVSYDILKKSLGILMDRELPEEDRSKIATLILAHKEVQGFHLLRTRSSGNGEFIQCHLELPEGMTLLQAHKVSRELEASIHAVYPQAEVILHQDPAHIDEAHRLGV